MTIKLYRDQKCVAEVFIFIEITSVGHKKGINATNSKPNSLLGYGTLAIFQAVLCRNVALRRFLELFPDSVWCSGNFLSSLLLGCSARVVSRKSLPAYGRALLCKQGHSFQNRRRSYNMQSE